MTGALEKKFKLHRKKEGLQEPPRNERAAESEKAQHWKGKMRPGVKSLEHQA